MNNKLKFCVYKITNEISGKSYIGKTCNLEKRWKGHLRGSKSNKLNSKFPNALRKYPEDTWDISILYETDDEDHCYEVEALLVDEYDTFHNGYNSCGGGKGIGSGENHPSFNRPLSNTHKLSISCKNKDKKHTVESKKKMSKIQIGKNNTMYNTPPWKTPTCKSRKLQINWFYLDIIYDLRIKYGYGPKRMYETLVINHPDIKKSPKSFQNMFKWFEKHGDPRENTAWIEFHNNYLM